MVDVRKFNDYELAGSFVRLRLFSRRAVGEFPWPRATLQVKLKGRPPLTYRFSSFGVGYH
jgi:hypothetical protein